MTLGAPGCYGAGAGPTRSGWWVELTGSSGGGGLVVVRLARLPEHAVDLQHVHPLAQLVLELRQPLLRGNLFPRQTLHLMFIFFLLPLQGLENRASKSKVS